jgi:hypothetical protein
LKSLKQRVPFEKGTFVEKLVVWANEVGWPEPEFTMLPRTPKGSKRVYTCRVTVHVPNNSSIFVSLIFFCVFIIMVLDKMCVLFKKNKTIHT